LVETELWKAEQALEHISQFSSVDSISSIQALVDLAKVIPTSLKEAVLTIMLSFELIGNKIRGLTKLSRHLPLYLQKKASSEVFCLLLEIIERDFDLGDLLSANVNILRFLPDDLRLELLQSTYSIKGTYERPRVLIQFLSYLPDNLKTEVFSKTLKSIRAVPNKYSRISFLSRLLCEISGWSNSWRSLAASEVLKEVDEIPEKSERAKQIGKFIVYLPVETRRDIVEVTIRWANQIYSKTERARVLKQSAVCLPSPQNRKILKLAWELYINDDSKSSSLTSFVIGLPESMQKIIHDDIIQAARNIASDEDNLLGLIHILHTLSISDKLKTELAGAALPNVMCIADANTRVSYLADLMRYLPKNEKVDVLEDILSNPPTIDDGDLAICLGQISANFSESIRHEALTIALKIALDIQDRSLRVRTIKKLSHYLPISWNHDVFRKTLRNIRISEMSGYEILDLLECLKPDLRVSILPKVQKITDSKIKAKVLSRISVDLPNTKKTKVLLQALKLARGIRNQSERLNLLLEIVPNFPGAMKSEMIDEMLEVAYNLDDRVCSAKKIAEISVYCDKQTKRDIFSKALHIIEGITEKQVRYETLKAMLVYLPKSLQLEVLRKVIEIGNDGYSVAWDLQGYLRYLNLSDTQICQEILQLFRDATDAYHRASHLYKLARHLPMPKKEAVYREALEVTRTISRPIDRVRNLKNFLHFREDVQLTQETLKAILSIDDDFFVVWEMNAFFKEFEDLSQSVRRQLRPRIFKALENITESADIQDVIRYIDLASDREILESLIEASKVEKDIWPHVLHHIEQDSTRHSVVQYLVRLMPIVERFGGKDAIYATLYAIQDVMQWWP
jgi:hypothetical protein